MSLEDDIKRAQEKAQADSGYMRWSPKEAGDSIAGVVVAVEDAEGDWGPFKVTVVEKADGNKVAVSWVGTVLKGKFTEQNVAVGKVVSLEYRGERANQKGTGTYQDWAVAVVDPSDG